MPTPSIRPLKVLGRYALYGSIARGGMATIHLGRLVGPEGFSRTVAIKRLHPQYASDPEFVAMFMDEARLAARIRHPNVVPMLDVMAREGELFLVMDYVEGESLGSLWKEASDRELRIPPAIASRVVIDTLHGLQAAHEARNERDEELGIVHRDVSPQNLMVGVDGVTRVLDFGVAKAIGRHHQTRTGEVKGKLAYMPPEQVRAQDVDLRADLYAVAVVLWEALTGRRLFDAPNEAQLLYRVLEDVVAPPSAIVPELGAALDALVLRGLSRSAEDRFASAAEMARELAQVLPPAPPDEVSAWMRSIAGARLDQQARRVRDVESDVSASIELPGLAVPARSRAPGPQRWVALALALVALAAIVVWRLRAAPADAPVADADATLAKAPSLAASAPELPAPGPSVVPAPAPTALPSASASSRRLPRPRSTTSTPASTGAKIGDLYSRH